MRRLWRVLCPAAVVMAAAAGCGGPSPTPTVRSTAAVFPLTISRAGGVAGFQDVLVVARDGLVSITRKGQRPRRCRLTPASVRQLTTAVARVPWARVTPAATRPAFPDDMVSVVRSPAGGPVRLEDPQLGTAGQVMLALLNEVHSAAAAGRSTRSQMCRPV